MHNLSDDQLDEIFRRMAHNLDDVFSRYNSDVTPTERELLRHLRHSLSCDLDQALRELRLRRHGRPPGLSVFGLEEPQDDGH